VNAVENAVAVVVSRDIAVLDVAADAASGKVDFAVLIEVQRIQAADRIFIDRADVLAFAVPENDIVIVRNETASAVVVIIDVALLFHEGFVDADEVVKLIREICVDNFHLLFAELCHD